MLIDSHCHLDMLDLSLYDNDLNQVIENAKALDVKQFICVAVDLEHNEILNQIQKQFPEVRITIGVHPNEKAGEDPSVEKLIELARKYNAVALGETGLDYYRTEGDQIKSQQERFRHHIRAARDLKIPIIVHTRQAREDTIRILQEENAADIGGVLHCFTETWEMAKKALDLNFYISFSGIVTFKNASELQDVARKVPLDRMLIETDSPYLAPVPYRGKPNQPAYVRYVAEFLAELHNIPYTKLADYTTQNCKRLFRI